MHSLRSVEKKPALKTLNILYTTEIQDAPRFDFCGYNGWCWLFSNVQRVDPLCDMSMQMSM